MESCSYFIDRRSFDAIRAVFAAVAVDRGADPLQPSVRGRIVEEEYVVDRFHSRQDASPCSLRIDGAVRTLIGADGRVAVEADDQDVALTFRLFQERHVTEVENIERAVRRDDRLSFVAIALRQSHGFVFRYDFCSVHMGVVRLRCQQ